jgi:RHS repeat-associated protein
VYQYDFENRLIALNPGTANQVTFLYDGDGIRVSKTVGGVTTKFLVDTNSPTGYAQVVEETVGGNVQRAYVHGHALISQTQLINSNWTMAFYGFDGHGSTRFLTDTAGAITDTYTFDAFGNLIASVGTTPNSYLFAGEQLDPNLGFYYLRARYMNPSSGRFFSIDSFEGSNNDPGSLHKYLYASGNPVSNVDPSGAFSIPQVIAIGVVLSIVAAGTGYLLYDRAKWRQMIITVGVDWSSDWELHPKEMLNGSEIDLVKTTAMETLRRAYTGFRVLFNESGYGYRKIRIRNQRHGSALGETLNVSTESTVFLIDHLESLDDVVRMNHLKTGRREYLEALGRGLGATAAHELGHQAGLGYVYDRLVDPSTYDFYQGNYELFFTEKHWSRFALERMRDVIPQSQ